MPPRFLLVAVALSGCAKAGQAIEATDGPPSLHDGPQRVDAPLQPGIDAPVTSGPMPQLLLTEVVLAPSTGEFIEIANPSATETVSLATYYLSDNGNYFRLPVVTPTVDTGDFVVRFPATATIGPKAVITVALDTAANFTTAHGVAPTYSIASGTMTTVASSGAATLTNAGELVALFRWDGTSDLVKDVDLLLAGVPSVANGFVDKSGLAQDGPDGGSSTTSYATDTRTMVAQASAAPAAKSTKRILLEAGHEKQTGGGNGITGDDETSENTAVTWDTTYSAPTPGVLPTGLLP